MSQIRQESASESLDQWRGLALVFVLISHGFYFSERVNGIGRVGVNLFFFISGILTYRSLLSSKDPVLERIVREFWLKRIRRLYPALLLYILFVALLATLGSGHSLFSFGFEKAIVFETIPAAVFYYLNFKESYAVSLGHIWSLACEAQFYLLAPILFWIGNKLPKIRSALYLGLLLVLLGFGFAHPFIVKVMPQAEHWKYQFEFAAWPMMLGFCCEWKRSNFDRIKEALAIRIVQASYYILFAVMAIMISLPNSKPIVVASGALLLIPCFLAYHRSLNISGFSGYSLSWLGKRTYSIYLWQQPLTLGRLFPSALHPVGALISILVGAISFEFVEKPFLSSLRRRK